MTFSVTMPALGESVSEGTVTRWLKSEGDHVNVDEPLLEVSTDKVDTEIPSPVAGTLTKIVVQVDQTVPVGAELAIIADGAAAPAPSAPVAAAPAAPVIQPPAAPVAATPAPVTAPAVSGAGTVITMPALGESVSEGTVTRWLKNIGDSVAVDEALLEVSTDKVDTEIPSPVAGTLLAIDVAVDSTVPVGARLGLIGTSGAAPVIPTPAPVVAAPVVAAPVAVAPVVSAPAPVAPATAVTQPTDAYVTPLVRKLANELGVNLANVKGSGIGGRIRREDVEALAKPVTPTYSAPVAATASAPSVAKPAAIAVSPLRGTTVTMSRLRKVIAARMVESLQVSAQLTTVVEVDVTKISRLRDKAKASFEAREGVKLSFLPFFAVAVCEALKQHPVLNSSVEGDQITYHGAEHLGIAVDTERGLLVPVIANAGDLNMGGIARKISDLAARTRDNKVTPDELGGGTFTLTNTGSRGALFDTPIINQPQVAILGLGAVVKRPMVVRGEDGGETIAIRSMVYLALSYDHRVVDGADAARFLVTLKERLEGGAFESDLGL
ncbi:MAG: 2-oxoglutarate dehydrogenase, E2 component, dihydrolipoamide succinyltransferase [Actinobacteria bacterium]|jgi:2-oxoglutarate dehydrogenase E2 component (dihydrolipoamide succinyltransferase)|nr:2-oxoglutarate dehydrogenase, E2 component, dihydrolipoamide succinyltransferase [Actinomycetota bacterium]NCV41895.1 2-oxoglutarate dehydrogenase, E2 component, dihydrolipoamide succinyltransferase [Actinomycetota bacterium]NCV82400.1 2-oxoglutarate dehydrogenase, E2 component, dihydrolipoamide succinyltransferase [Actinomycetota bacterium]NCX16478.1 2-oxoglutarate dehydrogenase, E2 component, dihydrolipoamide succinyltransferase [Actinomycetota bacterium]NCX39394.1 2-oxoglutarate dehydroge